MSKGLSKNQQLILALLRGTEPLMESNEEFQELSWREGQPTRLTTNGLLLEFEDRGFGIGNEKWKQWQFTIRRACDSLVQRGLVEGYYEAVDGHHTIVWQAVKEPASPQPA